MIRQHFGNALHWYQVLIAMAEQEVDTWIRNMTSAMMVPPDNTNGTENTMLAQGRLHSSDSESSSSTSKPLGGIATPFLQSDMLNTLPTPFPLPKDFLWMEENILSTGVPLIYLQRWCPICFSGKPNLRTSKCVLNLEVYTSTSTDIDISAQAIVCINTNFAQQRCHSHHPDPVDPHPNTHFLLVDDVESMRCAVEHARPSDSRSNAKSWATLPDDTLDDCKKAFTAVQGHIAKSSNKIFVDTALMALLCHHDRPLFLVNMTSAGE
jgi:hypothetical protein